MARGIPFTGESLSRYLTARKRWNEARDWQAKEIRAGRPSTYGDFCRAHGLCSACAATGVSLSDNGVGFKTVDRSGNLPLYQECEACGGTGRIVHPS